jgi:hypothetical protein
MRWGLRVVGETRRAADVLLARVWCSAADTNVKISACTLPKQVGKARESQIYFLRECVTVFVDGGNAKAWLGDTLTPISTSADDFFGRFKINT